MANFDKQIKKQGESFSLEPRKEVWQRLEAELNKTKRRRFGGWFWMLPVCLLAGTGVIYYTFSTKEKTTEKTKSPTSASINNSKANNLPATKQQVPAGSVEP